MLTCRLHGKVLAGFVTGALLSFQPAHLPAQSLKGLDDLTFYPAPLADSTASVVRPAGARPLMFAFNETPDVSGQGGFSALQQSTAIGRYEDAIERLIRDEGPFVPALSEQLLSLGMLYQESGQHDAALGAFDRAVGISRMNDGLYALDQIPLTEHMIGSLEATGRFAEVDEKHQFLVHLHRQFYGNDAPETAGALRAMGEWKLRSFHRKLREPVRGEMAPAPEIGSLFMRNQVYGTQFADLYEAQRTFLSAIRLLIEREAFTDPALPMLERDLLSTYFINSRRHIVLVDPRHYALNDESSFDAVKNRNVQPRLAEDYVNGEKSYRRQIGYVKRNPQATMQQLADAMLGLADWHLLFGRYDSAESQYRELEGLLAKANMDEREIEKIMQPNVPTALPTFMDTAISGKIAGAGMQYQGYVDVVLNLNRYGRVGDVDVLGSSEGTSKEIEARLVSLVRNAQFRPAQGEAFNTGVRYYYSL